MSHSPKYKLTWQKYGADSYRAFVGSTTYTAYSVEDKGEGAHRWWAIYWRDQDCRDNSVISSHPTYAAAKSACVNDWCPHCGQRK